MEMLKNLEGYRIIVLPNKIWVTGGLTSRSYKQIKKCYSFDGDVWQSETDMNQVKKLTNLNVAFIITHKFRVDFIMHLGVIRGIFWSLEAINKKKF